VRSFVELDLFDNSLPFDNTIPIYLINLFWKLGLERKRAPYLPRVSHKVTPC